MELYQGSLFMTPELKELLTKAYSFAIEVHDRRWEYLTLPLDERFNLIQQYIKEMDL
jgi:hypothetical protein